MGFEVQSPSEECVEKNKVDVPKIDISKRKEIFETQDNQNSEPRSQLLPGGSNNTSVPRVTLRDRFKVQETTEILTEQPKKELRRLSGDITSIKERLQSLEQQQNIVNGANGATKTTANKLVDIPVPPLKERLSSLQNAVTKEDVRKPPVKLVDARQLEIMKSEEEKAQQSLKEVKQADMLKTEDMIKVPAPSSLSEEIEDVDRDDSGIHTADDVDLEERNQVDMMKKEQELKLNAAIEALAKEEQQLSEAANAVNQIEAEFEELSLGSVSLPLLANTPNANAAPITNDHMEYSVSLTNPEKTKSCSNSYSREISSNNCNSQNSENNGEGSDKCATVKGLDIKSTTNLRRKPTNEMVHAKNLLKIFKETFQNDIELDEHESKEDIEIKSMKENESAKSNIQEDSTIKTQIFEKSKPKESETNQSSLPAHTPLPCSKIPLSITPLGKPPLSPLAIRSNTKFVAAYTPPGSPNLAGKPDSQFSINGRVEIFNSKTMTTSPNNVKLVKPLTPTMTTKKTQLPYINKTITKQTNNIGLPQQQLLTQEATAKEQQQQTFTVTEPLPTTNKSKQQQHFFKDNNKQMIGIKTKPSQQMVNEPQRNLSQEENNQLHERDHKTQQQQHQTEVVICAPPITIVNPDELPKPNTVKNLSSCFQQPQKDYSHVKPIPHKLLPRSFVAKPITPPSPVLPRRHICYTSAISTEEDGQESSSPSPLADTSTGKSKESYLTSDQLKASKNLQNKVVTTDQSHDQSEIKEQPREGIQQAALSENACIVKSEDKKFALEIEDSPLGRKDKMISVISSASTSSTSSSTGSTVIDNTKKLSISSDISSTSEDNNPEPITTTAQIHKQSQEDELGAEKKIIDENASKALVQEFINAESQACSLGLQNKTSKINNLAPLKIVTNPTAKEVFLQSSIPVTSNQPSNSSCETPSSNLPFTTPLQPLQSPTKELFKVTTPLVVSTLYDKYQPDSCPPTDQKTALAPFKIGKPTEDSPSIMKPTESSSLPNCPPNESTLYKISSSAPHTPNSEKNLSHDADICKSLLTSLAVTPGVLQRQHTVEEELCEKVDKETLPFHDGATGFKDISKIDIKNCEGIKVSSVPTLKASTQRQTTVEEEMCHKIDINSLPDDEKLQPKTGFKCVSPTEIRKCDNFVVLGSEKPSSKPNSKPNSPILEARAAHSRALIETCEKIIAEERLASSQLKSSLSSTPQSTPLMQRISKIPKPITSCCKATESLNESDINTRSPQPEKPGAIARLHVVETQIKVTTTTPPASPKASTKPQSSPQPAKKTKNIFDFLKKNFGVGGHSQKQHEPQEILATDAAAAADTTADKPVLVLSEEELKALDEVKYDEIHTFDNSKFYIPTQSIDDESSLPPPLPKTPAPVNIEITRKITTDEILEGGKTEKDLTKEIDDLLDDELNKLNHEIEKLEKAGSK